MQYAERLSTPASIALNELERHTFLTQLQPNMISGAYQGRFLSLISKLIRPQSILEIGTFTGYAAICLAEGLVENGVLHTIEVNEEQESIIRQAIMANHCEAKIQLHIGNAFEIIPTLDTVFDLVFIDAGKEDYIAYYELVFPLVRSGGLIIADNVLWKGKVLEPNADKTTRSIQDFNQKIVQDNRVEILLLPIRDGLSLILKK